MLRFPTNKLYTSLETIDYQIKDPVIEQLSAVFEDYKKGKYNISTVGEAVAKVMKKRFNIQCTVEVDNKTETNACYFIIDVADTNVLYGNFAQWAQQDKNFIKHVASAQHGIVKGILKGDLSPLGVLDNKKAVLKGLFSQIPIKFMVTKGALDVYSPLECTATVMHEMGHCWTFFEYLGTTLFRNAFIATSVKEFLDVKQKEERFKIMLAKKNVYGLEIDPKTLVELKEDDAVPIIVGAFNRVFKYETGFTNYDDTTVEAIADQFMSRFGLGYHSVMKFSAKPNLDDEKLGSPLKRVIINYILTTVGAIAVSVASGLLVGSLGAGLPTLMSMLNISIAYLSGTYVASIVKSYSDILLGSSTYDVDKQRMQRIYNETLGFLKDPKIPKELTMKLLGELREMAKAIEKSKGYDNLAVKFRRWFDSDFRSQLAKREYQILVESLLANELYVQAAKIKHIGN